MGEQQTTFEDLSIAFSLDALDGDEREVYLRMLHNAKPEEKKIHASNMAVAHSLAQTLPPLMPRPRVKQAIMQSISSEAMQVAAATQPVAVPDKQGGFAALLSKLGFDVPAVGFIWAAGSMAAMAFVVFIGLEYKEETSNMKRIADERQAAYESVVAESRDDKRIIALLQNPEVQMAALAGKEVNPNGVGQIVWDPQTREGFLRFANLPREAADKDYQLWFIDGAGPKSAGVFSVDGDSGIVWLSSLPDIAPANISAFGVTLEPAGGVEAPTGEMYLLGTPG